MSAPKEVPSWMQEQVRVFYERVEMLVLAFVKKHGKRPKVCIDEADAGKTFGIMAAFVDPDLVEEGVHPKLAELAEHGARAWDVWTKGLDPDEAIVVLSLTPGERGVQVEVRKKDRADVVRMMQRAHALEIAKARGASHLRRIDHLVYDQEAGVVACARCGGTMRMAGKPIAESEAREATAEETAWIQGHARCIPKSAGNA